MADTPRRNAQANRQARRQSPYARPEPQQAQQTPSRLRSLLSYVSPFRSAAQKSPRLEVEEVQDVEAERSAGEEDDVKQEEDDGNNSADEAAQFALHGRLLAGGQQLNGAPATPSPANGGTFPRSAQFRSLAPSLSLTASSSLPNLAGAARSPRPALSASPNSATHELARFWQEKAERGEEHLSAIEQAGVLQLMQQAQTESTLPTAFTPNFRSVSPPRTSLPFPFTASDALSAPPSTLPASRAGSVFGGDAPSIAGSSTSTAGASGFKRRRPLYVGAGYSSRRRTSLAAGKAAASGLTKSQSESSLFSLAEPSAAEGKRRRTTEDEKDEEDDIPVARLDDVVALPASPAPSSRKAEKAKEVEKPKLHSQPPFSRFNTGVSTPAKPSPLWQVSQADTASPSPPRKATPSTPAASSATAAPATTLTPKTAAADLMLGIIAQSDAANPAGAKKAKVVVEKGKEAFLNPYANAEGEEDLLSLGGGKKERVPRSRAKVATPGRARAAKAEAAQKAAEKEKERKEKEKKAQEISPLEQLERTMPAEYRPSKRAKAASPPPAPAPAKKEKKEEPEVVEILSSDAEEEDEAMQQDEEQGEEEDQLEQEDEGEPEEEEDEIVIASPPPAAKKPAFSFGGSSSTSSAFGSSTTPSAGFGGFGFAPTPSPSSPSATSSAKPAAAPSSAFSFAVPSAAAKQKKDDKPATPSPVAAPSSSFAFSVPSPAPATTSSTTDAKDPKAAALALPRSALPLSTFSFGGVFPPTSSVKGDAAEEAVKKLVKEMGKGELPTFAF